MYEEVTEEFKKFLIARDLEYWKNNQRNFSPEADLIFEKIEKAEKLTELDVFTITCEDQAKIDEYKKFYNIRQNIKNGEVSKEDINFLVDTMCGVDKAQTDFLKNVFSVFATTQENEK